MSLSQGGQHQAKGSYIVYTHEVQTMIGHYISVSKLGHLGGSRDGITMPILVSP